MCRFNSRVYLKMPKRSLKRTLLNNLTSHRDSSQEHLEGDASQQTGKISQTSRIVSSDSFLENVHENNQIFACPIGVSQTSYSVELFQENNYENNQDSACPTRAAKVRCLQT